MLFILQVSILSEQMDVMDSDNVNHENMDVMDSDNVNHEKTREERIRAAFFKTPPL